MLNQPLESRVYVYCRVVHPRDEESFDELTPVGGEPKKSHRRKTVIPRAGFYGTLNPFDLLDCPQGAFVNVREREVVHDQLNRFDGHMPDTPPIFCEFPASDWEPPQGTREVPLSEHANAPPYWFLMAGVTKHMLEWGARERERQEPNHKTLMERIKGSRGYDCFKRIVDREMVEVGRERNAHTLFTGLAIVLDEPALSERSLRQYLTLLSAMNDRNYKSFSVIKRTFLEDLRSHC